MNLVLLNSFIQILRIFINFGLNSAFESFVKGNKEQKQSTIDYQMILNSKIASLRKFVKTVKGA